MPNTSVHPLIVRTPAEKVEAVCSLAFRAFYSASRLMIFATDPAAIEFIDQLLWRYPKESFLPHAVSSQAISAAVVISPSQSNINEAPSLLNLTADVHPFFQGFERVYELNDSSSEEAQRRYQLKIKSYSASDHFALRREEVLGAVGK